jgi:hypothetical protein
MSATMSERTVLPGEPTRGMADLLTVLRAHGRVLLGHDLAVFVAYDHRLTIAAQTARLAVATPGRA